jgi:hypothetical protein
LLRNLLTVSGVRSASMDAMYSSAVIDGARSLSRTFAIASIASFSSERQMIVDESVGLYRDNIVRLQSGVPKMTNVESPELNPRRRACQQQPRGDHPDRVT